MFTLFHPIRFPPLSDSRAESPTKSERPQIFSALFLHQSPTFLQMKGRPLASVEPQSRPGQMVRLVWDDPSNINSCGRLLSSLHASGSTVPGFDCDSVQLAFDLRRPVVVLWELFGFRISEPKLGKVWGSIWFHLASFHLCP